MQGSFADAITALNAAPLDERVNSSAFGATGQVFVAAYYLEREVEDGRLGRLYVSAYDKARRAWIHASPLPPSGSATAVRVAGPYAASLWVPTAVDSRL